MRSSDNWPVALPLLHGEHAYWGLGVFHGQVDLAVVRLLALRHGYSLIGCWISASHLLNLGSPHFPKLRFRFLYLSG